MREALLMAVVLGVGMGFFMGSVLVVVCALLLPEWQKNPPKLLRPFLKGVSITSIAIPLAGIIVLYWGLVGAGLGVLALWLGLSFPIWGLGSPNLVFTLIILFLSGLGLSLSRRREWLIFFATFAGVFGWLLPHFLHQA